MEFVTTQRGARSLIYEGHKYVINRRGRESVDKDKKIGELKSRFNQNEITLEEYVRGISPHTYFYLFFVQSPLLYKLVQLVSTTSQCFGHILHE